MAKHSKDIVDDIAAENAIKAIDDAKELRMFIRGEQRDRLLDVAQYRLRMLEQPKQGQQTGPITQTPVEFKGSGVEGTKGAADAPRILTAGDIAPAIDEANLKRAKERERTDLEAQKAAAEGKPKPKTILTGEDVIQKMRGQGKKI